MDQPNKFAIVAFRGEKPCVLHALLNCSDMRKKGFNALVILEGGSVKFIDEMFNNGFSMPWEQIKPLIDCACFGCTKMFHMEEAAKMAEIRTEGGMSEHVSLADYVLKGYTIIVM
jgi:hypothetical protein